VLEELAIFACGQRFWDFISGNPNLYTDIIEPMGHGAKRRTEKFTREYDKVINKFTRDFSNDYCDASGEILWNKIVQFNSGAD